MKSKFCPSCGKATEDLYSGLCKGCFLKRTVILDVPRYIDAALCRSCGRVFNGKEWKAYEGLEDALKDIILSNSELMHGATIGIKFEAPESIVKSTILVSVHAEAEVEGKKVSSEKAVEVFLGTRTCDTCGMKRGGYYESVIQIRGAKKDELLQFIEKRIAEGFSLDKASYVTKVEVKKEGFDVYVGGKSAARKVAGEAKRIYNLELKKTYSQNGVKNGKSIFRDTILLRDK